MIVLHLISVSRKCNFLVNLTRHEQPVLIIECWISAKDLPAIPIFIIAKFSERGVIFSFHIHVDLCAFDVKDVVFVAHEEFAIVVLKMVCLLSKVTRPAIA